MQFPEVGVSEDRAAELKRLRESSQESAQSSGESSPSGNEYSSSSSLAAPGELAPLTVKDGQEWWADWNADFSEMFPGKFRPVPKPLILLNSACAVPLMNRLGLRFANAPTWALVAGALVSGIMCAAPGVKLMLTAASEEQEPTPDEIERVKRFMIAQQQGRAREKAPSPAPVTS